MIPSDFLRFCAALIHDGIRIDRTGIAETRDWESYVMLTLPTPEDGWDEYELTHTRVLRFLLAADIAESEGN